MGEQFSGTSDSAQVPGVAPFRTPVAENPSKYSKISLREHFLMRKLLPQKMHFFSPATYQASTWPARGYLSTNLPTHSFPQLVPPGRHGLYPHRPHAAAIVPAANEAAAVTGAAAAPSEQGPHLQAVPLSQVTPLTNLQQTQTLTLH